MVSANLIAIFLFSYVLIIILQIFMKTFSPDLIFGPNKMPEI